MALYENETPWVRDFVRKSRARNAGEFIPTWQVGMEQPNPNDVRKFAEDGYQKNSLIYSCIREEATSFAPLLPQVVRRDGRVVEGHRMTQLLMDPNATEDGQDFAELMATQFLAAGNVYIRKVGRSADAERRAKFAGFPVQELHLVRPDYVMIEPGTTRSADVFVVTVEGQARARIPRAEMIHIHEPHLTNDFYGLSKIAVLVREGSIDLEMSDFELAFFRNAGVPMGMLSVKGRVTEKESSRIKSKFRAAFQGVKKWFEVLVLNEDVTDYKQLAIAQKDMEMEGTRFHVESRICSVFGVPGIIVGARFALMATATQSAEEAEHQFWAETMVPFSLRFARAFAKHLLPEFAVQADRGATVTYDFSVVRALQEDRSRKLREVVRLVLTGGFTVNQALQSVGMERLEGGDFYVRNGNQVIVDLDGTITPMVESGGNTPNADNPLEGAARLFREVHGILNAAAPVPVPAGGVEDDETEEVAAVREVQSIFDAWKGRNGNGAD